VSGGTGCRDVLDSFEAAAEWLRSQGIVTYNPQYDDRYKHVYQNSIGDLMGDC
jgi:hypothetical protein